MNSMRNLALAAFAVGWLFAGAPAFACDEGSAGACSYPITHPENKADEKKSDKKAERKSGTRREGRRSARSGRYRHRTAYRSSRRWSRSSRRGRYQRFAGRRGGRQVQNDDEVTALAPEATTPAPIVNADDATVQVLPQAMETGTSLSPVPQSHIASALTFRFGPRASEAAPAPMQMAQATPAPMVSAARVVQGAGQTQLSAEMQASNVGQAASATPPESDSFLLRAMFLTLAGALTLATAVRLVIG